jgi:hypothetical protein
MRIACTDSLIAIHSVRISLCLGQCGKVAPEVITISCPQHALLYMLKDVFLSPLCAFVCLMIRIRISSSPV